MKKKFFVVIAIIVVLVILLTPVRMNLKDGGSVRYKALVYEVTKIHRLAPEVDGVKPYIRAILRTQRTRLLSSICFTVPIHAEVHLPSLPDWNR